MQSANLAHITEPLISYPASPSLNRFGHWRRLRPTIHGHARGNLPPAAFPPGCRAIPPPSRDPEGTAYSPATFAELPVSCWSGTNLFRCSLLGPKIMMPCQFYKQVYRFFMATSNTATVLRLTGP